MGRDVPFYALQPMQQRILRLCARLLESSSLGNPHAATALAMASPTASLDCK